MLQWRAKRDAVWVAPQSQGRVHRHHAGLLLLEFRAWGPGHWWFSVTHSLSINLSWRGQLMSFFSFLIKDSLIIALSCFFLKHGGVSNRNLGTDEWFTDISGRWLCSILKSRFFSVKVRACHKLQLGLVKSLWNQRRRAKPGVERAASVRGLLSGPHSLSISLSEALGFHLHTGPSMNTYSFTQLAHLCWGDLLSKS